jgi:lipopolysaccharide transport system permease protein
MSKGADIRGRIAGGGLAEFTRGLWRNRSLVGELVYRDIRGGHAGHGFGAIWVYVQPLVIVVTFMLVFGVVIGTKLAVTQTFPGDYTSYVLVGLVPWLLMQNALSRGPGIFLANANLVKQVIFPLESLPMANLIACFGVFAPSILVMLAYKLAWGGGLSATALLLPVVLGLHGLLALGLILILSVITPFVRDVREFITVYLSIAMYFTPAVYLPDWVPALIRPVLYLNPFSYVVWVYQDTLFFGDFRHGFAWVVFAAMAVVSILGGVVVFRRIRPFLGNVL